MWGFPNPGFPNPNYNPMMGMNIGGNNNWIGMYNVGNQNTNQSIFDTGTINVIFRTTKQVRTNITIDNKKTVSELIQLYFMRIGKPELFQRPMDICFIYNANKMMFNDQTTLKNFFGFTINPFVLVNDVKDLIGA